MSNSCKF